MSKSKHFEQNPNHLPPKKDEPLLHRAARLGDHAAIRRWVGEGHDINQLFDMGLDPGTYPQMATPLMAAAGSGEGATVETMKLLLSLGADFQIKGDPRSLASFASCGLGWNYVPGGDSDRLKLCLELGCDSKETDEKGKTLVTQAAETASYDRVKLLIDAGASPNAAPDAPTFNSLSKFKIPNSTFPFDDALYGFQIPLHCAVEADDFEMVSLLLKAGADVKVKQFGKETALFSACSPAIARLLIDAGLNVEETNFVNWTPLVKAICEGSIEGVKTFIAVGANINSTHDRGYTVFMSAVGSEERKLEVIHLLLEAGANSLAISDLGFNAFHAAIIDNERGAGDAVLIRSIFELLLKLGVDINHKNKSGLTPLKLAKKHGTKTQVEELLRLGAKED